jgi:hypothetical protein
MSSSGKTNQPHQSKTRKPPPRWRKYLVQGELELPPPSVHAPTNAGDEDSVFLDDTAGWPWWQSRVAVLGLALACLVLLMVTGVALWNGAEDRDRARAAEARAKALTLRAVNSERAVRIPPNPRSWSANADAELSWPEPPQLLELYFPVGYTQFVTFALVVDKVDHGRVMVVERMTADSNRDLRLSLNSSAFGPGEYRIRVQGYTWRGRRVDVGWVRLVVE